MDIIRNKRDLFRVEIRKQKTEELFQAKRLSFLQASHHFTYDRLFDIEHIKSMDHNCRYLYQFYEQLYSNLDNPEPFPFQLLEVLFEQQNPRVLSGLFTIVLGFLYKRGEGALTFYIDCLMSKELWSTILRLFDVKSVESETCMQNLQLVSASTRAISLAKVEQLHRIKSNTKRILPFFEKLLGSRNPTYVRFTLEALRNLAQHHTEEISKFSTLVRGFNHHNDAVRHSSVELAGLICCYGTDYSIRQLFKHQLLESMETTIQDALPQIRGKTAWMLGNIALYNKLVPNILSRKTLIKTIIDRLENDYYAVGKECIIALSNLLENVDVLEFEREYKYLDRLLEYMMSPNRDSEVIQCCTTQLQFMASDPALLSMMKQRPSVVSWLADHHHITDR